jgi:hypothetical protein
MGVDMVTTLVPISAQPLLLLLLLRVPWGGPAPLPASP